MIVRLKTIDNEDHVFKSDDPIEPLTYYSLSKELHAFRCKLGPVEYCFPLENIIWIKMLDKEV